jgi:hypothetical protein
MQPRGGVAMARIRTILAAAAIAMLAAACSSGGQASGRTAPATPAVTTAQPDGTVQPGSTAPATPAVTAATCDSAPFLTLPVTTAHQVPVPPVPRVTAVRVAQHPECGYDRIVLAVTGPLPGYTVRAVSHPVADASGHPLSLPGSRFLVVTLHPAQAHDAAGTPLVTAVARQPGFPVLDSWVLAGDNEGTVTIALGLRGPVSVRAGELPGRVYLDVRLSS